MADVFLADTFIRVNKLSVLEVVVLNEAHACVLGLSNSQDAQLSGDYVFRTDITYSSTLSIRRPAFVLPARLLRVQVLSSVDPLLSTLLEASLLFRLQRAHVVLGTVEYFKLLGTRTSVRFCGAVDPSGTVYNFSDAPTRGYQDVPSDVLNHRSLKHEDQPPLERSRISGGDHTERISFHGTCVFHPGVSSHGVFKVGPSTQVHIEFPGSIGQNSEFPIDNSHSAESDQLQTTLLGLDSLESAVRNYILEFAISSSCSKIGTNDTNGGILLYGLPGCGKSRLLSKLKRTSACENDPLQSTWCRNLQFVTLTPTTARSLGREHRASINPFRRWLVEQGVCTGSGHIQPPIVICLPDLDTWANASNSDMEDSEQAYDDEDSGSRRGLSTGSSLFQQFYSAIDSGDPMSAEAVRNICVIATATTTDGILRSPEGRQLFFRQILVPLPDAHTRHCILRQEIRIRVHNSSLCQQTGDMLLPDMDGFLQFEEKSEKLLNLASKLHGYTPRDLHRLVQISWASLLSSLLVRSPGDNFDSVAPTLAALCDVLARESRTYMQINLSQFTTPVSPLRWDDIGGYEHLKALFRTVVQNRLATAAKLNSDEALADAALGLRVPRGILLHGPPGCSKTMFVRALATECQLPLIAVQASRIFGRYVGDSERNMRRILVQARASAPAILFIDEIDLLLPSRSSSETGASEHVLSEVLTAMDGVEGQIGQVILIAATNRMEKLDSALSRAGRFDLVIDVPPPDAAARAAILRLELSRRALDDALSLQTDWLNDFAKSRLHDYTGAEVVQVVQLAAQLARNSGRNRISRSCLLRAQEECPPVSLNRYSSSCVPPYASLTNHLHQIFMLLPKSLLFASFSIFLIIGLVFYACFSNYS